MDEKEIVKDPVDDLLQRYLSADYKNRGGVKEEMKRLSAGDKAKLMSLPDFVTFTKALAVDALLGVESLTKGQQRMLEVIIQGRSTLALPNPSTVDTGPITVEAQE